MTGLLDLNRWLWAVTFILNAGLIFLLLFRKNHRAFPFFFAYMLLNLVQGVALITIYRFWGFGSSLAMEVGWGSQGLVTAGRALAVAEICHRILAEFRGIWRLAWRLLVGATTLVALYAGAVSQGKRQFAILNLDRGLELAMVTALVFLFLFAVCYEVPIEPTLRTLTIGFFLFSSFRVLNDTILERWLQHYAPVWNLLGILAFIVSLVLWNWALRQALPKKTFNPELFPQGFYREFAPEMNERLKKLNEQLSYLWRPKGKNI
jgi:hypothetical protein